MDDNTFGQWVQRRRRSLLLTQAELADQAACSLAAIRKIEADERRPSPAIAEHLARVLAIPEAQRGAFVRFARGERLPHDLTFPEQSPSTPVSPPHRVRHNLPAPTTALIGREQEVADVCALVRRPDVRLVTLSGPGGIGKTRLALQVAEDLLAAFPDGVWLVRLAPIVDPALVLPTIAETLGITQPSGQSLADTLQAYLHHRRLLLVLDNVEQVVAAVPLLMDLLQTAPHVSLLVTSRTRLHLSAEHELPVPPLALPDGARLPTLDVLARSAAVTLFVQRAQQVTPDFALTPANAAVMGEICTRLDGLPLAIELAAARIRTLSPQALLHRLSDRLGLLSDGARDLPARQQTLRNTLDWSYHLLDASEQLLFTRLAVFAGGCTIEAAAAVCGPDLDIDILDGLHALVTKHMLWRTPVVDDEPRFRMHETIREYAWEQLAASGHVEAQRQRHMDYFLALAEQAEPHLVGRHQQRWLARLQQEQENLRAALDWSVPRDGSAHAVRLAAALLWYWVLHFHVHEARTWFERLLTRFPVTVPRGPTAVQRATVLYGAGMFAFGAGDYATARGRLQESADAWREVGDSRHLAHALTWLGETLYADGDLVAARAASEESTALLRGLTDPFGLTRAERPGASRAGSG